MSRVDIQLPKSRRDAGATTSGSSLNLLSFGRIQLSAGFSVFTYARQALPSVSS